MSETMDEVDVKALQAIRTLTEYLNTQWISEGCRTHPQWGCASCEAVELERQLGMLAHEIRENAGVAGHI